MILEGEASVRAALEAILEPDDRIQVTCAAGTLEEAVEQARSAQPHVALVSTATTGGAVRAVRELAAVSPATRLLALSGGGDSSQATDMLYAGAIGYVLGEAASEELAEAIIRAARGEASFPAGVLAEVLGVVGRSARQTTTLSPATSDALVEHAPDAVLLVDRDGRIVLVNAQLERLFGYARAELIGEPVELLLPERFRAQHRSHRDGYAADPQLRPMGAGLELAGRRKDGTEVPVDISLSGIESDEGPLMAAFIRDDTMRLAYLKHERELAGRRAVLARVVAAGEEERRQIAADIHDDSIQVMTAAGMRLQILRRSLQEPEQLKRLDELERTVQLSIGRLRHLIFELRPPTLDLEGLGAALAAYAEDLKRETGLDCTVEDHLSVQPPPELRVVLYRIAQEVLTNVRKHASARNVSITLSDCEGGYHVRIADDGVGFTPDLTHRRAGHLGLAAIRERAELAGGSLEVDSRPGAGAVVRYWVRLDENDLP